MSTWYRDACILADIKKIALKCHIIICQYLFPAKKWAWLICDFYYIFPIFTWFYEEDAGQTVPEVFRMQLEYCGFHFADTRFYWYRSVVLLYNFIVVCFIWYSAVHFSIHHDDVIKWKHFPRYWPFVRGIYRSTVNSPHKGQWHGALMFSLICARINGSVNNRYAGDLRRHEVHYDVIVLIFMYTYE